MNKRVLIISPHFPPVNAPDHQRVRMTLAHYREFGWDADVLAVEPRYVEASTDEMLEAVLPNWIRVFRAKALPIGLTKYIGLGTIGIRAFPFIWKEGSRLLEREKYDLVFFSTTAFVLMALGPLWLKKFGVPYVCDYQDPWRNNFYYAPGAPTPPGGWLKFGISQALARALEPGVLRHTSHVISVSRYYVDELMTRYPWIGEDRFTVLPFGFSEDDLRVTVEKGVKQSVFDPNDGKKHWIYIGRGGRDMEFPLRALFGAIKDIRENVGGVRFHFIGTSYASSGKALKTVEPLAAEYDLQSIVEEQTGRIPYFETIRALLDSHAVLLMGSGDVRYSPSKIYSCFMVRKPVLSIFGAGSPVINTLKLLEGALVTFSPGDTPDSLRGCLADEILKISHTEHVAVSGPGSVEYALFSARENTRKLCKIFSSITEEVKNNG